MSKSNLLPVDHKMIILDVDNVDDGFWGTQEDFEHGSEYVQGYVDALKLKPVLKLEDDWGWDYMYQLPNGRFVMDDRNSGTVCYFTKREFNRLVKYSLEAQGQR